MRFLQWVQKQREWVQSFTAVDTDVSLACGGPFFLCYSGHGRRGGRMSPVPSLSTIFCLEHHPFCAGSHVAQDWQRTVTLKKHRVLLWKNIECYQPMESPWNHTQNSKLINCQPPWKVIFSVRKCSKDLLQASAANVFELLDFKVQVDTIWCF